MIKEKVVLPTDILRVSERRIFPAMLLLHFGEGKEVCCLNGYFYFDGTRGYFKLIEIVTNKLDLRNSVSAHLVIEVLSSIYEYNVHAIPLDETTWLISKIRTVEKNSCVCMLWNLEAFIITQEGRISVNIRNYRKRICCLNATVCVNLIRHNFTKWKYFLKMEKN